MHFLSGRRRQYLALLCVAWTFALVPFADARIPNLERRSAAMRVAGSPDPGAVQAFLDQQPGALKQYRDGKYTAAQIIEGYAVYYNLNPYILLTLLELKAQLLSDPHPEPVVLQRPWGGVGPLGFAAQIDWAIREIRAGFGPYTQDPVVHFTDGTSTTISRQQEPALVAVYRFLAQGHTQTQWRTLTNGYLPLYRQYRGEEPMAPTPTATPQASGGFLDLPWPAGTRMIHSSYFDHAYPTVDRGEDGNDFILNYLGQSNLSYNTHDANDYYFPDQPIGTPITAAASGIAYAFTARGNGVVIRHGGAYRGYETVYWHLDQFDVKFQDKIDNGIGVPVVAGEILGISGKSGFVKGGPHLHFEVRHNGRQVDPYGWYGGGDDPCGAWTAGCESSVWLWKDSLAGTYDFTRPDAPLPAAPPDSDPPVGTLQVVGEGDPSLKLAFDGHAVPTLGVGFPEVTSAVRFGTGLRGQAVTIPPDAALTYPVAGNLVPERGTIALWVDIPSNYVDNRTNRHYLFAASENPGDSEQRTYTNTLALRHQWSGDRPQWNFWTVDARGYHHELVITDTLQPGWHQFAISWDAQGGSKQIFIDGVRLAQAQAVSLPTALGDRLQIGRWTAGYGELAAPIDEFMAWQRVVSAEEIAEQVQQGGTGTGATDDPMVIHGREVVLDTNAIDAQGGVVSVQIKRDDEPWGDPLPYYDSYRWTISGTAGLHTFAVRYRDRADNTSVVTTSVRLEEMPRAHVAITAATTVSATLQFSMTNAATSMLQLAATADFGGAVWQPFTSSMQWNWTPGQPRVVYVRFRDADGLLIGPFMVGDGVQRLHLPVVIR